MKAVGLARDVSGLRLFQDYLGMLKGWQLANP